MTEYAQYIYTLFLHLDLNTPHTTYYGAFATLEKAKRYALSHFTDIRNLEWENDDTRGSSIKLKHRNMIYRIHKETIDSNFMKIDMGISNDKHF